MRMSGYGWGGVGAVECLDALPSEAVVGFFYVSVKH